MPTPERIADAVIQVRGVCRVVIADDPDHVPFTFVVIAWADPRCETRIREMVDAVRPSETQYILSTLRPPWWYRLWLWLTR